MPCIATCLSPAILSGESPDGFRNTVKNRSKIKLCWASATQQQFEHKLFEQAAPASAYAVAQVCSKSFCDVVVVAVVVVVVVSFHDNIKLVPSPGAVRLLLSSIST